MFKLFIWSTFCQIFILNNIYLSGYINPYYYIVFILLMSQKANKLLLLLLSFALGLTIDIFSYTQGTHAFACVLICYLNILWGGKRDETEENVNINKISTSYSINSNWNKFYYNYNKMRLPLSYKDNSLHSHLRLRPGMRKRR